MSRDFPFSPIHPKFNSNYNINSFVNPANRLSSISRMNFYNNGYNSNIPENNQTYYILFKIFDNNTKRIFFNFIDQHMTSKDIKTVGEEYIILQFSTTQERNEFINKYNKIKDQFYGINAKYINQDERDKIINLYSNRSYLNKNHNNNYIENNKESIMLPVKKSGFQKFLEVFLNL